MNKAFLVILGIILVVMGGSALLVFKQGDSAKPAASAQLGQPLLKGLKASEIASITIREPKQTLTLAKKDERWSVVEKNGFPADLEKVASLVVKAIELKAGQVEPIGEKDRTRLLLDEKGDGAATVLVFKAADGKILAELLVGKKYFKKEPEGNASNATADGRFVMLPADPKQMYTVADPLSQASASGSDWVSKAGFGMQGIRSLEVKPAEAGEGYRIERTSDGVDWLLDRVAAGQKLDASRANAAAYSLHRVEIEDVAAPDADTGLDKPTTMIARTFDGLTYTLLAGKTEKEKTYVRIALEGEPAREVKLGKEGEKAEDKEKREKAHAEDMKALAERVAREKLLKDHVLVVAASKLSDTLRKHSELLEQKKPDPAKK